MSQSYFFWNMVSDSPFYILLFFSFLQNKTSEIILFPGKKTILFKRVQKYNTNFKKKQHFKELNREDIHSQKNKVFLFCKIKSKSMFCPIIFMAFISSVETGTSKMLSLFS